MPPKCRLSRLEAVPKVFGTCWERAFGCRPRCTLRTPTPLFVVTGLILPLDEWPRWDREYLVLKRWFFPKEIAASSKRPEYYEVKGNDLCAPRNRGSGRNAGFRKGVLNLLRRHGARVTSVAYAKSPSRPIIGATVYSNGVQRMAMKFSDILPAGDVGLIYADSRAALKDERLGASYLSFRLGNVTGRAMRNLVEAPAFTHSVLMSGLQLADNVGSIIYGASYERMFGAEPWTLDYAFLDADYLRVRRELGFKCATGSSIWQA